MKLKGREFPFWAVKKSEERRYKCLRFFRVIFSDNPEFDKYYYDAVINIRLFSSGKPMWRAQGLKTAELWLSRSTVQNYSELSVLPSKGKQQFIVELFKL